MPAHPNPSDPLRPWHQPAQTIYDAFQREASLRKDRQIEEWLAAECNAVLVAAQGYAQQHGLSAPTLDDVRRAECLALCSADYGAKWAYAVADLLKQPRQLRTAGA